MAPAAVALLLGALVGIAAIPSAAAPACSFAGGVVTVSLPSDGDSALVIVGTGSDDGDILFGPTDASTAPCGAATVATTDSVSVTGGVGAQTFRVSLAGGPFGPGSTAEAEGTPEIEFAIDLGEGEDHAIVAGGGDADTIVAGSDGVNANAAENPDDVDVQLAGVEELDLEGAKENDVISAAGGEGTGDGATAVQVVLRGGDGNDQLVGGSGDDVLNGGAGDDGLDGGAGSDTASYSGAPAGVTASLADGSASGGDGSDTLAAIENLTGSPLGDTLSGDDGDNVFNGMGGDDAIAGGGGTDAVRYVLAASGVTVDLAAGTASGDGSDTLTGIENALGSAHDDVLRGDAGVNQLLGAGGNDTLSGAGGNDRLLGGDGDDHLVGGDGNDGVLGQAGDDDLRGNDGNDGLRGGGGDDRLLGGPGNDSLRGGPLADTCSGGPGTDRIRSCEA